ncbi:MAG: PorP/SprF family type IX secretion system membrane protein [Bacteroidales bacterium]|nr:PorP/SprF family type IX secretion system membrane protein [Bacteroidales bacterium]
MSTSGSTFSRIRSGIQLIVLFLVTSLFAQDINYTLYNYSPLFLNPANTGNFDGSWRLAANFRNQSNASSNPFRTASLSFDKQFNLINQDLAAGLLFINDDLGVGGLSYNKLYASLGYLKNIRNNIFSIGFQAGYVFGSINDWGVWNEATGDFSAPSGESVGNNSYLDLNAGILWRGSINILEPELGVSVNHLNKPNISFLGGDETEEIRYTGHLKVKTNLTDVWYLEPAFVFIDKRDLNLTILGAGAGYKFSRSKSMVKDIHLGAFLRNGIINEIESVSLTLGTEVGRIEITGSYDLNISGLNKASGNNIGAFEVSIIYKGISTVVNSYSIPCERY